MEIKPDDLSNPKVVALLEEHIDDMHRISPPGSVHTLDLNALRGGDISFWVMWQNEHPVGCVALQEHEESWAEIKSMRSAGKFRGQGLGKQLLEHILNVAKQRNYQYLRLETGCEDFFEPARRIYRHYGFVVRSPFANYTHDPNSVFMEKRLTVESGRNHP
jgi:putative acetyltransferase